MQVLNLLQHVLPPPKRSARRLAALLMICAGAGIAACAQAQSALFPGLEALLRQPHFPADVPTQHNDARRSGLQLSETRLSPDTVNSPRFGLLASRSVDDKIYAQPLFLSSVLMPGNASRDLVIVATANNSLYAFDAHDLGRSAEWQINLTLDGEAAVSAKDVGKGPWAPNDGDDTNIEGRIGIIGTPVIDRRRHALYVVARSKSQGQFIQRLHAIDYRTGLSKPGWPVRIDAQVPRDNGIVTFNSRTQNQRAALLLWQSPRSPRDHPVVMIAYGSHADGPPYHGWLIAYDAVSAEQVGAFCTTPNMDENRVDSPGLFGLPDDSGGGSIWQAGQGPLMDEAGQVYFMTGNGPYDPGRSNYGNSFVKLGFDRQTGFSVAGTFTPHHWRHLNKHDMDLGSAGPLWIPSIGRIVGGGKEGWLYALNPDALGGLEPSEHDPAFGFEATRTYWWDAIPAMKHIHGSPVAWSSSRHGLLVYLWGEKDRLRAYRFDAARNAFDPATTLVGVDGDQLHTAGCGLFHSCMPGAMLSLSADGQAADSGLIWASLPWVGRNALKQVVPGRLVAFKASPVNNRLELVWRSDRLPGHANASDQRPATPSYMFAKYAYPTVTSGKVFLPTFSNQLLVFGFQQ